MAKLDNNNLREKLNKIIEYARKKQAEVNEDGTKKYSSYEILCSIDVNDFISKNFKKMSYLSWADALHIVRHLYPMIKYQIVRHKTFVQDINGNLHATVLPYFYDPIAGYCVEVEVTIEDRTESCMLPVFDNGHHAKKSISYTLKGKEVEIVNMGDINYAHQRCLVKCLGHHGLGDYLYRGESLPSGTAEVETELTGQYLQEEVISLREKIMQKLIPIKYDTSEDRRKNIISQKHKDVMKLQATAKTKKQFEDGGCNIEYTKHLINMALALNIEVGDYIKHTPESK